MGSTMWEHAKKYYLDRYNTTGEIHYEELARWAQAQKNNALVAEANEKWFEEMLEIAFEEKKKGEIREEEDFVKFIEEKLSEIKRGEARQGCGR